MLQEKALKEWLQTICALMMKLELVRKTDWQWKCSLSASAGIMVTVTDPTCLYSTWSRHSAEHAPQEGQQGTYFPTVQNAENAAVQHAVKTSCR